VTQTRSDIENGLEALRLYVRGMSATDVAAALHVEPSSVRGRLKRLYAALGARDMVHAVVICAIDGQLTREDLRVAYEDRRDGSFRDRQEE
jgi:DNA-binding CsgD family transcriptional regulator